MNICSVITRVSKNSAMVLPVANTIDKFGIVNPDVFLGQMLYESANFTRLRESLNYSASALIQKFKRSRISIADAELYGRTDGHPANQERLANILYGGTFGKAQLGNTQPNDGWHFRGVGIPQLTGRANITAFAKYMGRDPELRLDPGIIAREPQLAADAAGWYWAVYKPRLNDRKVTVSRATELVTGSPDQGYRERSNLTLQVRTLLESPEP